MNLENYYLDFDKVINLKGGKRKLIIDMYRDMMFSNREGHEEMSKSIFNGLNHSGYLINIRDKKISDIVDGIQDDNN